MPNILPVSDLRNYNDRGKFVILDIEDYERERAEKKLLMKLREAEGAVRMVVDGLHWMN